ncbi:MAG: hypothetical protein AB7F88_04460 [Pyrinomonadaceae bacterium]
MKRCPECRRDYYDDSLLYCLDDGNALLEGPAATAEPATVSLPVPDSHRGSEAETRHYSSGDFISKEIKRHKFGAALIVGVVAVLIAGFAYGLYRFLDRAEPQRSSANIQTRRLSGDGKGREATISPDGKFLAYIGVEGGERSISIKQIETNSGIQIAKPGELDEFANPIFSPDGNFLYFSAESKTEQAPSIYRVPTLGGTPTRALTNVFAPRFSADGRQVSYLRFDLATNETSILVANVDGTNERKITSRVGPQYFDDGAAWSPDGKTLAVITGDDSIVPTKGWVTLIAIDDGTVSEFGEKWHSIDDVVWHPSGDSLIVAASDSPIRQAQIWEVAYPTGAARRLTNNLNGHSSVSITADGKSIVTGEIYARSAVWVSPDLNPEKAKQVMPASGDTWGIAWTPDDRIVYVSDLTGDAEIWIMDADGANAKPLTNDKLFKTTPVVSPDGRFIVFTSSADGGQIHRIDMNGGNLKVLAGSSGADNPDISPDGKWVIFSAYVGGFLRIMRVPLAGGEPQPLTDYHATEPRYSRDGTRFACFTANATTQDWTKLAIVAADGGPPVKIFDAPRYVNIGRGPVWTPDDKGITTIVAPGELQNLWLQPVDGGEGKQLTNFQLPGVARREYSRDGKRIALVRAEGFGNAIMITDFR